MRVIALTGGIACGKSTVAGWLKEWGAAVIDADAISRALTTQGGAALSAIFAAFGEGVRQMDGGLDRAKLAAMVFSDDEARARLNVILHPMIESRMGEEMAICRKMDMPIVVLDVPLLYEAGMEGLADEVWCVSASEEVQVERLKARDGLSREQAESRIRSQWPLAEKERRADAVIRTDAFESAAKAEALRLYHRAVERSRE